MKRTLIVSCVAAALFAGDLAVAKPKGKGPDYPSIAAKVVQDIARVKERDVVAIYGDVRDFDLLEEIWAAVLGQGGDPHLLVGREKMSRRQWDARPAKFDGAPREFELKLVDLVHVQIVVESSENPGLLKDVPADRVAAFRKSYQPVNDARWKKGIRLVSLGNGLYPTAATAKLYGLSKPQLTQVFWDAIDVDYAALQKTGEAARAFLAAGKELRVSHPNGTDLKVKIQGRPIVVSDGVITDEEIKKGGAAVSTWLPAGEVVVSPAAGSAEGKMVFDRVAYSDGEILGLTIELRAGKVVSMTAKPGAAFDRLKALYDAAGTGKDAMGPVEVGINPALQAPRGNKKLLNFVMAGMFTGCLGMDVWAGGTNSVGFSVCGFQPGTTMTVDGKPLVENGALKL